MLFRFIEVHTMRAFEKKSNYWICRSLQCSWQGLCLRIVLQKPQMARHKLGVKGKVLKKHLGVN